MALSTVEALFVPHRSFGELLLSGEDSSSTTWATLAIGSFDCRRAVDDERTVGVHIIFTVN